MKTRLKALVFFTLIVISYTSRAQEVARMVITDHLASSNKVSMSKPKPAAAKENFRLVSDEKGTQVMIYLDMIPKENLPDLYVLKFFAFKVVNGKNEPVDDRELPVKKSATFALSAFNFFDEGSYKIIVTDQSEKQNLAEGVFTISR